MPAYEYKAINPQGKAIKGTIDADNIRTARQKLRTQGIFPTDIREGIEAAKEKSQDIKRYFQSDRVGAKDLAVATRLLATLVAAGLPLVNSLQSLADQTEAVGLKRIIISVRESVEEGSALAKALANFPKAFPKLYVNMVASGEASGTLDTVLENLADYLESQLELRRKITGALVYPTLMLIFCLLVIFALVTFVVPTIVDIFKKQGGVLPLPTRITILFSNFCLGYWWLIFMFPFVVSYLVRRYYQSEQGKRRIDSLLLNMPLIGSMYRKIATARVASTLGALLTSGVGLLTALEIVKNTINNVHIAQTLEEAKEGVKEGKSLAKELGKSGIFPSMLSQMISIGETSGRLEIMLLKAGKSYESDVNASLSGLTSLIEPLMIIGLGGIVFCIVISILMPMVDLVNVIQK